MTSNDWRSKGDSKNQLKKAPFVKVNRGRSNLLRLFEGSTPLKINGWNLKIMLFSKRNLLFQVAKSSGSKVNLRGCTKNGSN